MGFPITNAQAESIGLIQKTSFALENWGSRRYVDKFGHARFLSDKTLHMVPSNYIGQQVLDFEDIGIEKEGLPRVLYFVDEESIIQVGIDGEFNFEHPDQNKYNPLPLISSEDAKKPRF